MGIHQGPAIGRQNVGNQASCETAGSPILGFSWFLVIAIGVMPIVEASLDRSPSITMPATIAFFVAVISGAALKQRLSWVGVVLHIYGQIAIWLSLFVMSLAAVLASIGSR